MIIVSLIGLKKCGKTTTAEALIQEFKNRGYKVGGVKSMPHSSFTIDLEGKDTWRHREAGADFVISLAKDEIAYIENRSQTSSPSHPTLKEAMRLVPEETDVLICEGLTDDDPRILKIVLAKTPELLAETFEVRGIERRNVDKSRIIALSGIMANEMDQHPDFPGLPVFNCSTEDGTVGLADLIVQQAV